MEKLILAWFIVRGGLNSINCQSVCLFRVDTVTVLIYHSKYKSLINS
jgi:hypothetical protein